jgi:hypothetical protein
MVKSQVMKRMEGAGHSRERRYQGQGCNGKTWPEGLGGRIILT